MATRVAAWPKWAKMTVLVVFVGFVAILTIPVATGYLDQVKNGHPSGYVVETGQDGMKREWTVVTTQVPNMGLTYLLANGENQTTMSIHPKYKYFSFYRKPEGYVNFQGTICSVNGGRVYYVDSSSRMGSGNQMRWNGDVRFSCPATNGAIGIEGVIKLR